MYINSYLKVNKEGKDINKYLSKPEHKNLKKIQDFD